VDSRSSDQLRVADRSSRNRRIRTASGQFNASRGFDIELSIAQKPFDSEPKRREAGNEMLQECYGSVKRWLKILHGQVAEYRPSATVWLARGLGRTIRVKVLVFNLLLSSFFPFPVFCPVIFAQSQNPHLSGQRSTDYRLEFAASAQGRSQLGTAAVPLKESYPAASEVWQALLQDAVLVDLNLPFQWRLALVDDGSANAFSLPDGELLVDRKLATFLGNSRGLWAALLSHEIAHVTHRHWLQRYSYESKLKQHPPSFGMGLNGMDSRWRMSAFDQQMEVPTSLSNFSHELEFEADNEGMMLMARTGFHPDFELALHHLMESNFAEVSSSTSSSTHPRWPSRDRNDQTAYRKAVEEFESRWVAADSSPGGAPPTVVFLGKPESRGPEPLKVSFSLRCMNPGKELKTLLAIYERAQKNGAQQEAIEFWQPAICNTHDEVKMISIALPAEYGGDPEWKGEIRILNSDGIVLGRSGLFSVHVDKTKERNSLLDTTACQH